MKILDNSKSLSVLASSITNGLGQIQPLSAVVTEELNGIYELEFTCLTTDKHYADLKQNGLVKVTVGDGSEQIFRVYSITEPINFVVTVRCQHISYDLSRVIVKPFQAVGAVLTCNSMIGHVLGNYPFTMTTDISNTTSTFKLDIPRSFRECLGGYEGSILDVFRGEYEWDNLEVKMLARRGHDNGVRISYGKNLTDYEQETNNESVYDGVYGYAVVDEVTYQASSIYNKTGASTPKVLAVDFSNKYESGDVPTPQELLDYATQYATNNDIEIPKVNIKVDFIPLWQTEEYRNVLPLERVSLGDTVHVYFDELGVEASSRVIKTEWNVLTQKYDSIELGDSRANMNTVITDTVQETVDNMDIKVEADVGWLDDKLENITTLIANGLGLHITQDSAGRIILHNEETIAQSQYQYMITAQGFMLSEDYGQNWSSGWTTSGDAVTNSLSTITLKALEIYGSNIFGTNIYFGDPTDQSGKYILAHPYDEDEDGNTDGVTFDGTGYTRFQPQEQFIVNNLNANGDLLNEFVMGSKGTNNQPYITLKNYDHKQNCILANEISMDASLGSTNYEYNRMQINNYSTRTGTSWLANNLLMEAYGTQGLIALNNYKSDGDFLNRIRFEPSAPASGSRWEENGVYIQNYKYGENSVANTISMRNFENADLSSITNTLTLFNYNAYQGLTSNANSLSLESSYMNSMNSIGITNNKYKGTLPANTLTMGGYETGTTSDANYVRIRNYDTDGNNIANVFSMSKSRTNNYLEAIVNRGGQKVASMELAKNDDNQATAFIGTAYANINGLQYYNAYLQCIGTLGQVRLVGNAFKFSDQSNGGIEYTIKFPNLSVGQTGNLQVTRA